MRVSTPEGIDLDLSLAGLGSRVSAALIDGLVLGSVTLAITFLGLWISQDLGGWAAAVTAVLTFLLWYGYAVLLETLNSGRTLGKMLNGLRVVRTDGGPVTFRSSAVRNLLWWFDGPITMLLAGSISILATPRNQRLGDLAAGTVVIRELRPTTAPRAGSPDLFPLPSTVTTWDVSAITPDEVAAVRGFLERRLSLPVPNRARIAIELATRLHPKVIGAPPQMHPEALLEGIRAAKSWRDSL